MPDPVEPRDRDGRTFSEYVTDQVMAAIIESGMSVRGVARASGLERTGLQDKLNGVRDLNVREIGMLALALGKEPADLIRADEFTRHTD